MLPGFTAPKILWLKNNEPENYRRLAHVLLPHDYLNYVLTGRMQMEYGDASGTALLDIRTRTWSRSMTNFIGPQTDRFSSRTPFLARARRRTQARTRRRLGPAQRHFGQRGRRATI